MMMMMMMMSLRLRRKHVGNAQSCTSTFIFGKSFGASPAIGEEEGTTTTTSSSSATNTTTPSRRREERYYRRRVMLAILVERDHAHGGVDADEYISDGFGWTVKRERERESFLCGPHSEERL